MNDEDALIAAAVAAAAHAHCPYSGFRVGAALRSDDGRIFTGANVENSVFGLTICAERAAVFAAISAGARRFSGLVVATGTQPPAAPCGACRQVLAEFCSPAFPVTLVSIPDARKPVRCSLGALLPHAFKLAPSGKDSTHDLP